MDRTIATFLALHGYADLHVKAVFFDMDGVLFDSMPYHAKAWVRVLNEYGVPFTETDAYRNEGRTGASTINEFFMKSFGREATADEIEEIYRKKSQYFKELYKVCPIKDVEKVLSWLQLMNIELYVVTGSGQTSLLDVLDAHFPSCFCKEKMVTAFDVKYGKPHPEPYLMALEKSGLKPSEVMVVENAPLGVRSAVAAGLYTVAVNTGVLNSKELSQENASIVLPDMSSLLKFLKQDICALNT